MKRIAAVVLALALAIPAAADARPLANGPGRYAPRDECAAAPGAAAFRASLSRAVARRDAAALAALADPGIVLDFGGGAGRVELRRRLTGPEGPVLWQELSDALRLGCAMQDGGMTFPWFFAQDLGDLDAYTVKLVAAANVPLREVGDPGGRVLRMLSWQLVSPTGDFDPDQRFVQVDVVGMRLRGFVATARLRSQIGYRLTAQRRRGVWKIDAFVAGD